MKSACLVVAACGLAIATAAHGQEAAKQQPVKVPAGGTASKASGAPAREKVDLSQPTLFVVGYAHLDTQWRWTYVDTIREFIPNTLNGNFALFEKYPDYVFNFSGSRRYRMMEEYYPEEFAKLKQYVAAGKWFPCGSSVDENDANVPSAESLIRHVLYGNKYFRATFGKASEEYMLPDCFGFPAALPSVLAHCGIKGFSTQKLTWNAVVPIPFKVGEWLGPDGTGVVAALDPGAYVGDVKENLALSSGWLERIKANGAKSGVFADYHYFGTGDQGGAPREASVDMVQQSAITRGGINVISGPADALAKAITPEMREKLPRYQGELELTEHSAGSLTSEAYMKRWNRKNELLADAAERASVAAWWMGGRDYPGKKLEDAWYLVLGSQMHDILPGTSVPRAYEFSWNDECLAANQFSAVLEDAAGSVIGGMDTRGSGTAVVVYNPTSVDRVDVVEAEVPGAGKTRDVVVTDPEGKPVPAQVLGVTEHGERIAFLAHVPSVGFASYTVRDQNAGGAPATPSSLKVSERQLENEFYTVKIDERGDVSSVFDKRGKREVLSGPARLELRYENPRNWPAWNQDWADRQRPAKDFVGQASSAGGTPAPRIRVVENGPARVAVEVTRECEGSTFTQRIRLASGSARVEFDTNIDWRSRERSLRAAFPLAASCPKAIFDIQTGAIERGSGTPRQFEYQFHRWMDLTDADGGFGASILCDSKYGCDKPDDHTLRLTLLHTPGTHGGYSDQGTQDLGRHHVTYALVGHSGGWAEAGAPQEAACLNQPLEAFVANPHEGALGARFSLIRSGDPDVEITALKKAEASDEVIVRLRELSGKGAKAAHIVVARPIVAAREVDGQEREIGAATVQSGELVTDVREFGIRAFALKLGEAPAKLAKVKSAPIELPFDTDVVSTNANRSGGAFDEAGRTIPAEQFPATIAAEGVTFKMGSGADGQKNAVSCRGQEIAIPSGDFSRLYLLAGATEEVSTSVKVDGDARPLTVGAWTGFIGQWDRRLWKTAKTEPSLADLTGIEPGYVKPEPVAWFCSHHHTKEGDAYYQYCYLYKCVIELPQGARKVTLPNDPRIKVMAASVADVGAARASAAAPLFDTLKDHVQDAPIITPASGTFSDATELTIEPRLYWKGGAIHYTLDGSEPRAGSPAYEGPIALNKGATMKAAVVGEDGKMGPASTAKLDVSDTTPPSVKRVIAAFGATSLRVDFSEPLDASAAEASRYSIDPSLAVKSGALSADRRTVTLTLAGSPEPGRRYHVKVSGVKDASPAGNTLKEASAEFSVSGPVFSMDEISLAKYGTSIKDVPGLPVKAHDQWTINVWVKAMRQPRNRTLFAGFGKCAQMTDGQGRYLGKFGSGAHFWSHNEDLEGNAALELNAWQMLTATCDGKTLRLYKDGKKVAERGAELADDENVVWIAPKEPWESKYQFEGDLRGLAIWSEALSDDAIEALRASAKLP